MSADWKVALVASSLFVSLTAFSSFVSTQPPAAKPAAPPPVPAPVTDTCPAIVPLPAPEPSRAVPTLVQEGTRTVNRRVQALAGELAKMWTRNPQELVETIERASHEATKSPSETLLLAIAYAETNGKILDVSEAGAVGLAQATPIAIEQEAFDGKLFVTDDYLAGARAYIMKKPLGDADFIASSVIAHDDARSRKRAKHLLRSAFDLRREGVDDLNLLAPFAKPSYFEKIRKEDAHNLATLKKLQKLLDRGSRRDLRAFRDGVRREYRDLKRTQADTWRQYQLDLAARRDAMLEEHFHAPARVVKKTEPYEAGEYLAEHLDERFSAKQMADFLVRHLERKENEARKLTKSDAKVEEMTAALYNGGSHNVKRMLAGLIRSLPETERYMKKVPATRRRLDSAASAAAR
jgi:hypothetical protein